VTGIISDVVGKTIGQVQVKWSDQEEGHLSNDKGEH
jgi:hypothetical protein